MPFVTSQIVDPGIAGFCKRIGGRKRHKSFHLILEINIFVKTYILIALNLIAVHLITTPFCSDVNRKSMHKSEVRRIK